MMDYDQTLSFLYDQLPMFSRLGTAAYKSDLVNIQSLSRLLDHPEKKFRSVHIAGTNGKGSTSHMLAAILQQSGYKTGLYTSPHLHDFRERIRVNGHLIPESFVTAFIGRMMPAIESIQPSFFELTVAMAFDWFAEQAVDIAVIEVGLGGRLDSTNIILPELSVITNISYDHTELLGNTLEKIAFEKAGIIKPGIPVVIGEEQEAVKAVFLRVAAEHGSLISFAAQKRFVDDWKFNRHLLEVELTDRHTNEKKHYSLDLPGIYQTKNIVTAAEAVAVLRNRGFSIPEPAMHRGLQQVKKLTGLHGRWDILHEDPLLVLDVGHNEEGMKEIVRQIELTDHEELHLVIGMVKDKAIENVLRHLPPTAHYYFTKAQIPRALPETELAARAADLGLKGSVFPEVNQALQAAVSRAHPKDLILVCGSVFLAGEVHVKAIQF
jgi:dihydrofolate synthase/folylpolyglutamate synthase